MHMQAFLKKMFAGCFVELEEGAGPLLTDLFARKFSSDHARVGSPSLWEGEGIGENGSTPHSFEPSPSSSPPFRGDRRESGRPNSGQ